MGRYLGIELVFAFILAGLVIYLFYVRLRRVKRYDPDDGVNHTDKP